MCYKIKYNDHWVTLLTLTFIFLLSFFLTLVYGCSPPRLIPLHCVDVYLLLKRVINLFRHYTLHPRASCFLSLKGFCPCVIPPTDFSQHAAPSSMLWSRKSNNKPLITPTLALVRWCSIHSHLIKIKLILDLYNFSLTSRHVWRLIRQSIQTSKVFMIVLAF